MSGRDSSRLGDTADTELERRRREQEAREATRSERREQVAEQLDLEPEQLERRQFDDRGEEIGFVPDDEGRDELRDQRADDDPFVEPGDLDVEADRRGTRVRIDEDRRDAVGERAAEDVASDDPFVEPEDLDPDVGERGVRDVTVREDRRDVVGERAAEDIASDDPFVEARDLDVDVGETGVQEARIAEDRRDAVGERAREDVAADGEFIEREDVTVEVGERGIEDIDIDEAAQRRSAVADIDDDTPVDIDRDDVERTDDGFTLRSDVQERVAVTEIDEDTPVDIGRDDVERTGDGFALRDDAQREVAAAEIDDEIDERDISPDDLERTDDGFALDDDVQQDLAADEIEDALLEDAREDVPEEVREFAAATGDPANIDPRGVREARDAFQAGEIDPRELQNVVAAFREDDPVPTADTLFNGGLDADDVEETDDGFEPDDGVSEDLAAREIDAELPEVDIGGDDVTIEENVTEETRVDPDTDEQDVMRDVETEARLTDAAQQRVAEQQLEDLAGDLESGDDVLIAPGVGVDDATGPTNLVLDFLRPVERGDLGAQADLGSVVDTGVNIPRSPTALVQQADPELAEDLLDIDADRVRDAQAELEAREELAEEDPQEIIEAIDDSPDRFVERAGIVERRLEMGQRQRDAARDAAEDLAAEFDGVESEDIDRDFSSRNVEVGLGDEAVDTVQRRAAAEELGVDPDAVERTDDGFAVAEATGIEEAREELVDDIDDATLADIGEDDVAFDESDGQLEAELTDRALEREQQAIGGTLDQLGGGPIAASQRRADRIEQAQIALEDMSGGPIAASERRSERFDELRADAADELGVDESAIEIEQHGDELRADVSPVEPTDGFDADAQDPGRVAAAIGAGLERAGDTPFGRTLGAGVDGLFGDDFGDSGALEPLEARLDTAADAFDEALVDPIRDADPGAADPESAGLVRPFGVDGEFVQETAAQSAEFANVPAFASGALTATEAVGRAGQQTVATGPEALDFAADVTVEGARAAPGAAVAAGEFVQENPRDVAATGAALTATLGAGVAASRGARAAARRTRDVDVDVIASRDLDDLSVGLPDRRPEINVRRDPDAGFLEVDPVLQQQIREAGPSVSRPSVSGSGTQIGTRARDIAQRTEIETRALGARLDERISPGGRSFLDDVDSARTQDVFVGDTGTGIATDVPEQLGRRFEAAQIRGRLEARAAAARLESRADDIGIGADVGTDGAGRARSAFDDLTQPAGDDLTDIFGTAGRPGDAAPLRQPELMTGLDRPQTGIGQRARGVFDEATQPAGDGLSDIFGTVGAVPGGAGVSPAGPSVGIGQRARGVFDEATQPAGDSLSDIFGTAGAPPAARLSPGDGVTAGIGQRARSAFDDATQPAGDDLTDIFGTAGRRTDAAPGGLGDLRDLTIEIRGRGGVTVDADDLRLDPGELPDRPAAVSADDATPGAPGAASADGTVAQTRQVEVDAVSDATSTATDATAGADAAVGAGAAAGAAATAVDDDVTDLPGAEGDTASGVDGALGADAPASDIGVESGAADATAATAVGTETTVVERPTLDDEPLPEFAPQPRETETPGARRDRPLAAPTLDEGVGISPVGPLDDGVATRQDAVADVRGPVDVAVEREVTATPVDIGIGDESLTGFDAVTRTTATTTATTTTQTATGRAGGGRARPRAGPPLPDTGGDDDVGLGALDADVEDVVEPTRGLDEVDADVSDIGVIDDAF